MHFTRYGTHWKVDEFGALWFELDDLNMERVIGAKWLRWYGIDI
jgi:DNA (cytosine-5)-methyltransferase 1